MPMLVTLREREDGSRVADPFLRASEIGAEAENAEWMTVVFDVGRGEAVAPSGSIGFRWGEAGVGRWNLDLGEIDPALSLLGHHDALVEVTLPRFEGGETEGGTTMTRGVPAEADRARLVTTVLDPRPVRGRARGLPATGRRDTTTRRCRTRPPGSRRSRASTRAAASASPASSPPTRSAPRAAR